LSLKEEAYESGKIKSSILEIMQTLSDDHVTEELLFDKKVEFGDAVILMAADGYGKAKVEGHDGKRAIVVRTSDVIQSFKYNAKPEPEQLYDIANGIFKEIANKRYMEHGENPHN
jgi:hypothetical protein